MEKKRKEGVMLLVLTISAILITVLGVSYAYFTAGIVDSETDTTIEVEAGQLNITYNGGDKVEAGNIFPGNSAFGTKIFTVAGVNNTTMDMNYWILLNVVRNTFSDNAITYDLTSNKGVQVAKSVENAPYNLFVADQTGVGIPTGRGVYLVGTQVNPGVFNFTKASVSHTYNLIFYFKDKGTGEVNNQNDDQLATFRAYITIQGETPDFDKNKAGLIGSNNVVNNMTPAADTTLVDLQTELQAIYEDDNSGSSYDSGKFSSFKAAFDIANALPSDDDDKTDKKIAELQKAYAILITAS